MLGFAGFKHIILQYCQWLRLLRVGDYWHNDCDLLVEQYWQGTLQYSENNLSYCLHKSLKLMLVIPVEWPATNCPRSSSPLTVLNSWCSPETITHLPSIVHHGQSIFIQDSALEICSSENGACSDYFHLWCEAVLFLYQCFGGTFCLHICDIPINTTTLNTWTSSPQPSQRPTTKNGIHTYNTFYTCQLKTFLLKYIAFPTLSNYIFTIPF
jgi:hypothetical protein